MTSKAEEVTRSQRVIVGVPSCPGSDIAQAPKKDKEIKEKRLLDSFSSRLRSCIQLQASVPVHCAANPRCPSTLPLSGITAAGVRGSTIVTLASMSHERTRGRVDVEIETATR